MTTRSSYVLIASLIFFAPGSAAYAAAEGDSHALLSASLRMIWGLLIVLALLLVIYALVKKRLTLFQSHGKGIIKLIETRHLLPKKSLFLIEVRGQEFLLGTGGDSLELIARITPSTPKESFDTILNGATRSSESQ